MGATLRDIARMAGVHPGTASRAMNPDMEHLVNEATARRVRHAAEQLGYVPNSLARSLKTSRTQSLGALVPDIANPLFPPIIRGIEDVAAEAGFNVLIANTDDDPERERRQVASLRARQVDGLILASARRADPVVLALVAAGVPVVLVNRVEPVLCVPGVAGDDTDGIRQAVAHLHALGHRRIAHLAGPAGTPTGAARLDAFRRETAALGLDAAHCPVALATSYRTEEGARCTAELLDSAPGFTALLAANDLLALGCFETLAARGLRCPEDLSVVGFNDMPFVDRLTPSLTTVRVPQYDCGAQAARLLLSRLRAPVPADETAESVLLPLSLVVRQSTGPVRAGEAVPAG
ncbi:LacI family transcription regulator [Streptomyces albus]|uniref:LacI family transcription regulator n=1 Tax=Streptomyces albus (strain ATCC 21838 / DSM 41398 / FERM P-419 / JCM 4703 / NBRC 107858) TaxID=1081613 RepID=A0A0B5EPG3_STRA4|nr:LacI family transcription regulator [Streptomyces albus]AOU77758.1 LacI family transcription regulator [Streptomyces albus]AYN33521.1 LacI family transcription regulator [Streptomyces albus]